METRHGFISSSSWRMTLLTLSLALGLLLILDAGLEGSVGAAGHESAAAPWPVNTAAQTCTITYAYDNAGRLVGADYDDGQAIITYTYDAGGNLLSRKASGPSEEQHIYLPLILKGLGSTS